MAGDLFKGMDDIGRETIFLYGIDLECPDDLSIETLDLTSLPQDWRNLPAPVSTQAIGADWLQRRSSVALRVPSVVVPVDSNVLLNPRHPDMNRVRISRNEAFRFDSRLL